MLSYREKINEDEKRRNGKYIVVVMIDNYTLNSDERGRQGKEK